MITLDDLTGRLETIVASKADGETEWQWWTNTRRDAEAIIAARDDGRVTTITRSRRAWAAELRAMAAQARAAGRGKAAAEMIAQADNYDRLGGFHLLAARVAVIGVMLPTPNQVGRRSNGMREVVG